MQIHRCTGARVALNCSARRVWAGAQQFCHGLCLDVTYRLPGSFFSTSRCTTYIPGAEGDLNKLRQQCPHIYTLASAYCWRPKTTQVPTTGRVLDCARASVPTCRSSEPANSRHHIQKYLATSCSWLQRTSQEAAAAAAAAQSRRSVCLCYRCKKRSYVCVRSCGFGGSAPSRPSA